MKTVKNIRRFNAILMQCEEVFYKADSKSAKYEKILLKAYNGKERAVKKQNKAGVFVPSTVS